MFSMLFFSFAKANSEKKLAIIITSYNNAQWFDKNIGMMFAQKNFDGTPYQNYRIIYIDDRSLDGTAELVECYIINCNQQARCTLIKNKERKRALANLYYALQLCQPDEIVFNMDGDDWLADEYVFAKINQLYQDPEVWITYGSFINWPTNEVGYCQAISDEYVEKQLFRKKWWKPGQLRTFYAWLAHQVQIKDLLFEGPYFQGEFFPANADLAYYYPMMEMAGYHYRFIPELIYIRNVATPINDFKANKEVQILGSKFLREKEKYKRLESSQEHYFKQFEPKKADLILFSENPAQAQILLQSCDRLICNLDSIYIIYTAAPLSDVQQFLKLSSTRYPLILTRGNDNLKQQTKKVLQECKQDHIIVIHDGIKFTHFINCSECIMALERAFAYGFFLSLGNNRGVSYQTGLEQPMPALNKVSEGIYAWAFHYADTGDWRCYNNLTATLYRKKNILEHFDTLFFDNYRQLCEQWSKIPIKLEQIGLCYESPKIGYMNCY